MLRHLAAKERCYVSLENPIDQELARADPISFLAHHQTPVLIDAVHLVPELFAALKAAIDSGAAAGSFWLISPVDFKALPPDTESCAGRLALLELLPLSQHELYGQRHLLDFSLNPAELQRWAKVKQPCNLETIFDRVWHCALPGCDDSHRDEFLADFISRFIEHDVAGQLRTMKAGSWFAFLCACARQAGCLLNERKLAQAAHISAPTAHLWLTVLEHLHLIYLMPAYRDKNLARLVRTPKLFFTDTGLAAFLCQLASAQILAASERNRALLENYVITEIRKRFVHQGKAGTFYHYRDFDQVDIPLLWETDGMVVPFAISKTAAPTGDLSRCFTKLQRGSRTIGPGAVLCAASNLQVLDQYTVSIPIAAI